MSRYRGNGPGGCLITVLIILIIAAIFGIVNWSTVTGYAKFLGIIILIGFILSAIIGIVMLVSMFIRYLFSKSDKILDKPLPINIEESDFSDSKVISRKQEESFYPDLIDIEREAYYVEIEIDKLYEVGASKNIISKEEMKLKELHLKYKKMSGGKELGAPPDELRIEY